MGLWVTMWLGDLMMPFMRGERGAVGCSVVLDLVMGVDLCRREEVWAECEEPRGLGERAGVAMVRAVRAPPLVERAAR